MTYKTLKLPRLPIGWNKQPQLFERYWDEAMTTIENNLNAILVIPEIQAAIDAANAAAAAANTAATTAQNSATAAAKETALVNSYIDPTTVLSATPAVITIASHVRHYADGTTASVSGGTVAATASLDVDYVYYSDPTRAGGTVTYLVSTTQPPQTGNTHVVGAVTIPAAGTQAGGGGPQKPGYVEPL